MAICKNRLGKSLGRFGRLLGCQSVPVCASRVVLGKFTAGSLAGSWLCMSCWVSSVICKINGPKTMPKSTEMNTTNLPKIDNNYAWGAFGRPLGHQLVPRTHPRSFPHDDCLTFWEIISDFGRGGFWRGSQNLHFWYRCDQKCEKRGSRERLQEKRKV